MECIMGWLNKYAGGIQAVFTIVIAILTFFYVRINRHMREEMKKSNDAMLASNEELKRSNDELEQNRLREEEPVLSLYYEYDSKSKMIDIICRNISKNPIFNLEFSQYPQSDQYEENSPRGEEHPNSTPNAIIDGIQYLPPMGEYRCNFIRVFNLKDPVYKSNSEFKVTYQDKRGNRHKFECSINPYNLCLNFSEYKAKLSVLRW